jgi:hypothetical protein
MDSADESQNMPQRSINRVSPSGTCVERLAVSADFAAVERSDDRTRRVDDDRPGGGR